MRVMSTLKTVWTCGLVAFDSTMRLAMIDRILDRGTNSPGSGAAVGVAAAFAAAGGAGAEGAAVGTGETAGAAAVAPSR